MAFALVDLKWTPDVFWQSTPCEVWSAIELMIDRNPKE